MLNRERSPGFVRHGFLEYLAVPVFGSFCFLLGASFLFAISLGRWRVRRWPEYGVRPQRSLEPTRMREGRHVYFAADVALVIGLGVLVLILLVLGFAYALARG